MKKIVFFLLILSYSANTSFAQNISVTDDENYEANTSAMLDVKSTNKGMLVPRLTTAQKTAISAPATGLMIYDTDLEKFCYYNGKGWVEINPVTKEGAGVDDALFAVVNPDGDTVFAVYPEGVRIYVEDGQARGSKGGFAVGGFDATKKGGTEYLRITPDSVRIYVDTSSSKGSKGGFAVGGFDATKGTLVELMRLNGDSARIYVDNNNTKGSKGGFAVGGFDAVKTSGNEYLRVTDDSVRIYIDQSSAKGSKGGFAVGGFDAVKGETSSFFNVDVDTAQTINPSEPRVLWYPTKEAFLTGRVLIESPDSVGTNSFASGYESRAIGNWSQSLGYKSTTREDYSTAIGRKAVAEGINAFALGDSVIASGDYSYAFGQGAQATGVGALAFGREERDEFGFLEYENIASGRNSIAIGIGTQATDDRCVSIGVETLSDGQGAVAMGYNAQATASGATAIGVNTTASGQSAIALGLVTSATSTSAFAAGNNSHATGLYSTALGTLSDADAYRSAAIGYNAKTNGNSGSIVIGDGSSYDYPVQATAENQFTVRAVGGYQFFTDITQTETNAVFYGGNSGNVGLGIADPAYKLDVNGNINITGEYFVNGAKKHAKSFLDKNVAPETIEEHADLMWENGHLPSIKSWEEIENQGFYSISARSHEITTELEKAHIYIEQLNKKIKSLEKQNYEKDQVIKKQQQKLDDLKTKVDQILQQIEISNE